MNIRNWGPGQKMQLPDHCFGQRWPVSVSFFKVDAGTIFDISELALPDVAVIWFYYISMTGGSIGTGRIKLALGDFLPANDAQFNAYEPLFRDLGVIDAGHRYVTSTYQGYPVNFPMRKLIYPQGRRLVGRFVIGAIGTFQCFATLIVSGLPSEVPDCLLSG